MKGIFEGKYHDQSFLCSAAIMSETMKAITYQLSAPLKVPVAVFFGENEISHARQDEFWGHVTV